MSEQETAPPARQRLLSFSREDLTTRTILTMKITLLLLVGYVSIPQQLAVAMSGGKHIYCRSLRGDCFCTLQKRRNTPDPSDHICMRVVIRAAESSTL